jgi:[ribosomal protein S5]-alanine N-acetyltransferase
MHKNYSTPRLVLQKPALPDAQFFLALLNTTGWLQFIGNRNVKTESDAVAYLEKILANANIYYWVAKTKDALTPIGVVTLIKKEYLPTWDIGFAFLPAWGKQGFATEAVRAVLKGAEDMHASLLAVTRPDNKASIKLLLDLDFTFTKEFTLAEEALLLYEKKFRHETEMSEL